MILENIDVYDGTYLRKRFAYDHFLDKTQPIGNIIAFRAPVNVEVKNLVDKDKIIQGDSIVSGDVVNFCMEIPNISMFAGICFHRIFNSCIGNILASEFLKCDIEIDGTTITICKEYKEDGIIRTKGVASISDINRVDDAVLIYTGININAGKKANLNAYSTHLNDDQCVIFMRQGIEFFYSVLHEIFVETTKKVS
jgi:hypothetical protein